MQTSSIRRQMKNMVNNYTEAEIKVREATSNDPWGPSSSLMAEIADLTFNVVAFAEVMGMVWKRLNDHGKNWRHVYKALTLLDYLIKTGSERVARDCRDNIYSIQTLRDFQYLDRDGRDQGLNVREKAKQLVALLRDEEKLKKERTQALKTKTRMTGVTSSLGSSPLPPPYPGYPSDEGVRCRSSPSSFHSPDLEQARPATSGEEELQLQLALAMSREESEKPVQRAPAAALDMDEETQLQLALSLSKEEHQQEQLSRQGDESLLQKALDESKREMEKKGGTAFMDLVDVFAVPTDLPPSDHRWNNASHQAAAGAGGTDHWDSFEGSRVPRADSPWMVPPPSNSPPPPWEPPANPWDPPQDNVSSLSPVWSLPANTGADLFTAPLGRSAPTEPAPRTLSPSDADLFDDAMDGGQVNGASGREDSPELFDLSRLRESLNDPSSRTCRTPESFLDPSAASLVNLDSLIPGNPSAKNKNPFLSGLNAPSPSNPFQADQPKLSLNQMGTGSALTAPHATSLPYSASLPLPTSHPGASIPSSHTHPTHPGLDLPVRLPEPLLPFSSASAQGSQAAQSSQNPFL
ncbi:epsin-3 isoform X3 [Maylandia zebra]|uniref:epsin-3 isoform X3 n=1 Tax=Maylandia zebra TaxID=106582 RepID=UPI0003296E6C|nr:epsin-3 isoform X3 [Maylandia zebra]XP_026020549.1 epsin-3-like isoform X3 [Astatotilapia calliptera]